MARFIGAVAFGFALAVLLQCAAAQTVHVVGDSMGWSIPQSGGAQAYENWANGKNFAVGDILTFNFATNAHDVLRVPEESFDDCSSSNAIGDVITTGPVNITLDAAGDHYYICTFSQHCQLGQKLSITVSATPGGASPPSTSPTPRTPTTPSPASNNTPADCAPTPASSPKAGGPTGSGSGSLTPPPPSSSSSNVLASFLVSMLGITMGLFF